MKINQLVILHFLNFYDILTKTPREGCRWQTMKKWELSREEINRRVQELNQKKKAKGSIQGQ